MKKIAGDITELIGNTPLLELNNYSKAENLKKSLIAKIESFNPASSIKDRTALSMIKDAEEKDLIKKGGVIIEPTSGNTGIALAYICAARGYSLILTMSDTMSIERRNLLKSFGAKLVLTPGNQGMLGAINKAEELLKEIPGSFMPQQFNNPSNPEIHYKTTGVEIWNDMDGEIDVLVAGVGTGGTISGSGKYLKEKNSRIKIVAVEPAESAVLSGKNAGPHKIQGIGAGFIPENYDRNVVDEIIVVPSEDAIKTAKKIANHEGFLVGISSGAALYAGVKIALRKEYENKNILVILPDNGERYISTGLFD